MNLWPVPQRGELTNSIRLAWHVATSQNRGRILGIVRQLRRAQRVGYPQPAVEEHALIDSIRSQTDAMNRNNLTRTAAYLTYYRENPEVHWSLLAHVVSRNGGYGMTDLQGEWFHRTAAAHEAEKFFPFLERANWLIFGDAYPQLLLYQAGKQRGQNLCHLLGELNVSRFMEPIWNDFWQTKDSRLLTRALIVNEQNYIESRVVQNPRYSQSVLDSLKYQVQSLLNLNQVVIPFYGGTSVRLAGTTMHRFVSLNDRIETGKRLYRILYQDRRQAQAMVRWVNTVTHTGSRSDYWPEFFSPRKESMSSGAYKPRFLPQASPERRVYSPRLQDVWPDVRHTSVEAGDWFHDTSCLIHLFDDVANQPVDFTDNYIQGTRTVENILMAKDKVTSFMQS